MSTLEEENEIVEDLAIMMRGKLRSNSHKASWREEDVDIWYLVSRLEQETKELVAELRKLEIKETTPAKVRMECADVANIAAMISDISKWRYQP